jgi:hypothetical protein
LVVRENYSRRLFGGGFTRWHVFKFRPSSHSEDYTLIATYEDEETAKKVRDALFKMLEDMKKNPEGYDTDWDPDEAEVSQCGDQVTFEVYTAGYLDDVEALLEKVAKPQSVECYQNYQEITIYVQVPKGLSLDAAMLVMDKDEAEAIKWLRKYCGEPEVLDNGKSRIFKWDYAGDGIYSDGTLYLGGFKFPVDERKNWSVE